MPTHTVFNEVKPPSAFLALAELPRAIAEYGLTSFATPLLLQAPRGDGHPVLVLPGFTTTDRSTAVLRRYLAGLGYDVHGWGLGRNLGPRATGLQGEKLIARLESIYATSEQKVSLVGWSLGGMFARQLSRRKPDLVRQILTMGAPFAGDPRSTNVWRLYEMVSGQRIGDPDIQAQLRESFEVPPVPSTAIYSKHDGIVPWQSCREPKSPTTDNIEVPGSHCGLGFNPAVLYAVADRLAQAEAEWKPFDRKRAPGLIYPSSGHTN